MGSGTPTFAIASNTFLGVADHCDDHHYVIAGVPYDLGTSNRPGTRLGPHAIRHASRMLVDGAHPTHNVEIAEMHLVDVGNFPLVQGDMMGSLAAIREAAVKHPHLIVLGGDHSITLPLLQAAVQRQGKPLGLLHFDAHLDTWPDNFGGLQFGHGNPFYNAIEQGLIETSHMIQIGIRSPVPRKVLDWTVRKGSTIMTALDVHGASIFQVCERIEAVLGDYPTYLTIDIDVLDPAFAPGTGTPEIGGLATWQLQAILRHLRQPVNFVGMDIVEVSPPYDHAEITSLAAATMVWEYLSRMVHHIEVPLEVQLG